MRTSEITATPGPENMPLSLWGIHYEKAKVKMHLCTGTEALYRPYGPYGE
jgi:hypothetical protein